MKKESRTPRYSYTRRDTLKFFGRIVAVVVYSCVGQTGQLTLSYLFVVGWSGGAIVLDMVGWCDGAGW